MNSKKQFNKDTENKEPIIDEINNSNLSKHQKQQVIASIYQGPIPPASELEKYGKLYSDAPKKLIDNAVEESEFRRKMFSDKQARSGRLAWAMMIFMFIFATMLIIFSYLLIKDGNNIAGSIFGVFGGAAGIAFLSMCVKGIELLAGYKPTNENKNS